ncbi:twin-arginine translocase subunit TatC [Thermodesulfobacteriota bacterium]
MLEDEKQPFLGHLEELRKRLIYSAIAVAIGFVICYAFSEEFFNLLVSPLKEQLPDDDRLIFTNLPEMFLTYLKTAIIGGILLTSPVIFYQIWMFVAPGLYKNEKKYIIPFVISSTILFVGGALFGYFVVFPFGFKFFLGYANDYIQAMPSVKQYFSFAIKLLFAFGVVFELPVVIFFLSRMGLVTASFLRKKRKYAILITFAMAAILTPPDIITQCMMAVPLIVLYEIGIIIAWISEKKKAKGKTEDAIDGEAKT